MKLRKLSRDPISFVYDFQCLKNNSFFTEKFSGTLADGMSGVVAEGSFCLQFQECHKADCSYSDREASSLCQWTAQMESLGLWPLEACPVQK